MLRLLPEVTDMPGTIAHRDERIDLRVKAEVKEILARAAAYTGESLSHFLVSAASERARTIVTEQETRTLTQHDWKAFLAGLDDADRARPKLEAAAKRYMKRRTGKHAG
jgi:uncharacterized protein (DUF1778 family)